MDRLVVFLLWLVVIVGAVVAFDQVMVRVPLQAPVLAETQTFYRDFRTRLVSLARERKSPPAAIEGIIEQHGTKPDPAAQAKEQVAGEKGGAPVAAARPVAPPVAVKSPRATAGVGEKRETAAGGGYVYVDHEGMLHMAARLEDVPAAYRAAAQPLKK